MSFDVRVGDQDVGNYTANLSEMWQDALGQTFPSLHGLSGADAATLLIRALADLEHPDEADHWRQYEPANGWGKLENGNAFLRRLLRACLEYPDDPVEIRW